MDIPKEVLEEVDFQVAELKRGVVDLQTEDDLRKKLAKSLITKTPLRVKAGFDPTAPDLHLGHTVVMMKMRRFQELGHTAVFLIGDFTSRIGDPTGRNDTRPVLTEEEIQNNAETYRNQVFQVLDPEKTEVCLNSDWFMKLGAADMVQLASRMTVARMLERDDFKKRFHGGRAIGVHEFLYPLTQGYDSVAIKADVELGGTDQLFNLLVGRELQRDYKQSPQVVMTMPLLEGLDARNQDGVLVGQKMSKSLGNYVGIQEPANTQFGKLMSISDDLMWRYYELISSIMSADLAKLRADVAEGKLHPMDLKKQFAREVVERFHGTEAAGASQLDFETRFSRREIPEDLPEVVVESSNPDGISITHLLREAGLSTSGKEARRSCIQGAVRVDGEKIADPHFCVPVGTEAVVQVGRRKMARVTVS